MRLLLLGLAVILSISLSLSSQVPSAGNLTYLTEQFPPYNLRDGGTLQGISVDLLEAMWQRMNVSLNRSAIVLLPWSEGYRRALTENGTVLFSTARLEGREELFKWVGPIGPIRNVLLAKSDSNISIADDSDLTRYKIGAIRDDSAVQMLADRGLEEDRLVLCAEAQSIIEMLQNGSIDAWAYGDTAGLWLISEGGQNPDDFRIAYVLGTLDYYYAFDRNTPEALLLEFQNALDDIKTNKSGDGMSEYERILSHYEPVVQATEI